MSRDGANAAVGLRIRRFSFGRFVKRHPHKKGAVTDLLIGDLFRDELDEVFTLMDEMKAEQGAFEEPAVA
jgi:hypothetical protein